MRNIHFHIWSMIGMFLILFACAKDIKTMNQKPIINISHSLDGLNLTINGTANDPDGKISEITIFWGDNNMDDLFGSVLTNINLSHSYLNPGTYTIRITARDNVGDSTSQSFPLIVDFNETKLTGIKETMFKKSKNEYLILTLNLHTYQETQQNEKFNIITDIIGKMDIDFIALQECAQNKSSAIKEGIVRVDNMALIISDRLKQKYNANYNYVWNWSHYGWTVWEEGLAILSKYPLLASEDRYISSVTDVNNISSRKAMYATYQLPKGRINIFSAHTHWRTSLTDEEQNNEIKNIQLMVDEKEALTPVKASIICGDFNGNPTSDFPWSEGYNTMMKNNDYKDSFFEIYPAANSKPPQSIYNTIGGDLPGRIDYIFIKNNAYLKVVDSQIIFKNDVAGNVSDHYAVLTKLIFVK
ncbi:MAG: endonuclease/exonuclease/phosphatase family protein [Bacteroidales bacterium]